MPRLALVLVALLLGSCAYKTVDSKWQEYGTALGGPINVLPEVKLSEMTIDNTGMYFFLDLQPRCETLVNVRREVEEDQYSPGRKKWGERGPLWGTLIFVGGAAWFTAEALSDDVNVPLLVGVGVASVAGLTWLIVSKPMRENAHRDVEYTQQMGQQMWTWDCPGDVLEDPDALWARVDYASAKMETPWGHTYEVHTHTRSSEQDLYWFRDMEYASGGKKFLKFFRRSNWVEGHRDHPPEAWNFRDASALTGQKLVVVIGGQRLEWTIAADLADWMVNKYSWNQDIPTDWRP